MELQAELGEGNLGVRGRGVGDAENGHWRLTLFEGAGKHLEFGKGESIRSHAGLGRG